MLHTLEINQLWVPNSIWKFMVFRILQESKFLPVFTFILTLPSQKVSTHFSHWWCAIFYRIQFLYFTRDVLPFIPSITKKIILEYTTLPFEVRNLHVGRLRYIFLSENHSLVSRQIFLMNTEGSKPVENKKKRTTKRSVFPSKNTNSDMGGLIDILISVAYISWLLIDIPLKFRKIRL